MNIGLLFWIFFVVLIVLVVIDLVRMNDRLSAKEVILYVLLFILGAKTFGI